MRRCRFACDLGMPVRLFSQPPSQSLICRRIGREKDSSMIQPSEITVVAFYPGRYIA